MNIEWIFPTEIWNKKIENYKSINKKLYKASMDLFNYDKKGREKSNYGGWHSDFLHNYENYITENFNELIDIIYKILDDKKFGLDLKITDMWVNINNNGDYNLPHCHSNCNFSGCYYVKVPEDSGNMVFLEPYKWHNRNNSKMVEPDSTNFLEHSVILEEGMLHIFRGFLPHKVNENLSKNERVSIAFNIKGKEWQIS